MSTISAGCVRQKAGRHGRSSLREVNVRIAHTGLNRRDVIRLGAAAAAMPLLEDVAAFYEVPPSARASVEWRQYAGDKASTKYSSLVAALQ